MSNYSYLSPDEMILINILNTMYNDNYRQIEQLQEGNTRIMTSIMNILSNVLHTRERNRQGANTASRPGNPSTRRENNTPHQTASVNPNNVRRVNSSSNTLMNFLNNSVLNNTPYMVDNIEYIPLNSTSRNGTTVSNSINEILQKTNDFLTSFHLLSDEYIKLSSNLALAYYQQKDNENVQFSYSNFSYFLYQLFRLIDSASN
jgi:hypothetical protein